MNGTNAKESGNRDVGTGARWMALVAAGLYVLIIIRDLVRPSPRGWASPRILAPVGLFLSMGSIVVTHKRVKMLLAVCGAILVIAAFLFHVVGA